MQGNCFSSCFEASSRFEVEEGIPRIRMRKKCISLVTQRKHGLDRNLAQGEFESTFKQKLPKMQENPLHYQQTSRQLNSSAEGKKSYRPTLLVPGYPSHINFNKINPENSIIVNQRSGLSLGSQREQKQANISSLGLISQTIHEADEESSKKQSSLYGGAKCIIKKLDKCKQASQELCCHSLILKDPQHKQISFNFLSSSYCEEAKPMQSRQMSQIFQKITISSAHFPKTSFFLAATIGRGKDTFTFLGRQEKAGFLCAVKYIPKSSSRSYGKVMDSILRNSLISHPNVASIYHTQQNPKGIVVFLEHSSRTLEDQLKQVGNMCLSSVKACLTDIIQATVYLHEANISHGNLCPQQINFSMNTCKLRPSLTSSLDPSYKEHNYLDDIHGIAIVGYQMAFGLKSHDSADTKESIRSKVIQQLTNQSHFESPGHKQLRHLLLGLLACSKSMQLSTSACLTHPFFQSE